MRLTASADKQASHRDFGPADNGTKLMEERRPSNRHVRKKYLPRISDQINRDAAVVILEANAKSFVSFSFDSLAFKFVSRTQ